MEPMALMKAEMELRNFRPGTQQQYLRVVLRIPTNPTIHSDAKRPVA